MMEIQVNENGRVIAISGRATAGNIRKYGLLKASKMKTYYDVIDMMRLAHIKDASSIIAVYEQIYDNYDDIYSAIEADYVEVAQ